MAQPPAYTPATDFSADEANTVAGRSTVKTTNLDTEFVNIKAVFDAIRTNLAIIQADDGTPVDNWVDLAALSSDVTALLSAAGVNPIGAWVTATAYSIKDIVVESGNSYMCAVAHTSGTFATDLAAVKWITLSIALSQVDETSSDATKDKVVSNLLAKGWEDHKGSTSNPHAVSAAQAGLSDVDVTSSSALFTKLVNNVLAKGWEDYKLVGHLPLAGGTLTGNITFSGGQTFDGRDVSVDGTKLDGLTSATKSNQEAGSDLTKIVTPGQQHSHPSAAKFWIIFNGTGTVSSIASYNVTSLVDNGTGDYTINFVTNFSSGNYSGGGGMAQTTFGSGWVIVGISDVTNPSASAIRIETKLGSSSANIDPDKVMFSLFGDQ